MTTTTDFRELCRRSGLALTHQRQAVFDSLTAMPEHQHPSPEQVYERVRKLIPSISPATVYKTLHTFVEQGIVGELSPHHGSLRVEINTHPHHHLICSQCKMVMDVGDEGLEAVQLKATLPNGFRVGRVAVEIQGLCQSCANEK